MEPPQAQPDMVPSWSRLVASAGPSVIDGPSLGRGSEARLASAIFARANMRRGTQWAVCYRPVKGSGRGGHGDGTPFSRSASGVSYRNFRATRKLWQFERRWRYFRESGAGEMKRAGQPWLEGWPAPRSLGRENPSYGVGAAGSTRLPCRLRSGLQVAGQAVHARHRGLAMTQDRASVFDAQRRRDPVTT
jgi:hypothetical protein